MSFNWDADYPNLKFGLSERQDGTMKILPTDENRQNRERFFAGNGISAVVAAEIVHGNKALLAEPSDSGKVIAGTDGLATSSANLFLSVTVADCFPVYFFDPKTKAIGLAHAGWKGILAGIIPNTLRLFKSKFGSKTSDIFCFIGPGIQQHHFEIRDDILPQFKSYSKFIKGRDKLLVDLPGIINSQLLEFGLLGANITVSDKCTYCLNNKYFSLRRDRASPIEAMVAYIGIKG